MRKVWRDIADMNPLESDNKLVTCHFGFASPLPDLQADSRTCVRMGGAPLMPPRYLYLALLKYALGNVSRFHLRAQLSRWNPPSGAVEMATVTSVPVLLFKMRCIVTPGLCSARFMLQCDPEVG